MYVYVCPRSQWASSALEKRVSRYPAVDRKGSMMAVAKVGLQALQGLNYLIASRRSPCFETVV